MRISDWSSDVCSSDLVVPMAIATGPGAEMRQALGVTVFSGMLGVTLFGLFLTPVFYVTIRGLTRRLRPARRAVEVQPSGGAELGYVVPLFRLSSRTSERQRARSVIHGWAKHMEPPWTRASSALLSG